MNHTLRFSLIVLFLGAGLVAAPRSVSARSWAQPHSTRYLGFANSCEMGQVLPSPTALRFPLSRCGGRGLAYSLVSSPLPPGEGSERGSSASRREPGEGSWSAGPLRNLGGAWAQGKQCLPSAAPLRAAAWLAEQPPRGKPSGHKDLFDWINFVLLVVVLVYVLRKPVGHFFESRSATLEHDLEEGRKALEAARAELAQAEEKMRRLEADIAAFKASAIQERELELARLRQAGDEEGQRILESARNMIESATQAARLELKRTAANEAVALAEKMIRERLDEAGRARLVSRFLEGIR